MYLLIGLLKVGLKKETLNPIMASKLLLETLKCVLDWTWLTKTTKIQKLVTIFSS